jgi:ribonucleotide reductase beta subunit family protein with ferritin-like domain
MSIEDTVEGWVIQYPEFSDIADEQMHNFWPWDEPEVENDVQDVRVHMTEQERHGLMTVLKLFTIYEMYAGDDYWAGRILRHFKRPEVQRMASLFSAVEFNSHAPFYNKINELLYVDTEKFYASWKEDPQLVDRMKFIENGVRHTDIAISLAAFSFIEGAVLYSSFAFLKHFQSEDCGKDLIKNICRGINLSVGDENLHAIGSALLFEKVMEDRPHHNREELEPVIRELAKEVYEHEATIVDKIFERGEITGITVKNLKDFVKHRVNVCLINLGYSYMYPDADMDGFIASWFYANVNSVQFHDFFTGSGSEYHIDWDEQVFGEVW